MTTILQPIDIYTFGPAWGIPVPTCTPFGLKVLTWMRLRDLPYRIRVENDPSKGPKGKCPWAVVGGEMVPDSEHIITAIKREHGVPGDELGAERQAIATATRLMLEDHYHQIWEHELFVYEGGWKEGFKFFDSFPPGVRVLIRTLARRALRKQLIARGMGRHSHEQIVQMGVTVLDAVDELLGDDPYFFGEEPFEIDACVFAFMALTKWIPVDSEVWEHFHGLPRLGRYCERMLARCFSS
ncbi:MAG: glutathione S-transferase family protein [Myxococcota bacterium]